MTPPTPIPTALAYRPADTVVFQSIGGEGVLLDLARETYYGLNAVGMRIWTLLGEGRDAARIATTLAAEFDAPAERIAADVDGLLAELADAGLIVAAAPGDLPIP